MSTQLTRVEPESGLDWLRPQTLDGVLALAKELANAEVVPKDYIKKPANILIAMAVGRRLGFDAVTAMGSMTIINGKAGLFADAMVALCKSNPICLYFRKVEESDTRATWETQRNGEQAVSCTVTMQQAERAGWPARNPNWRTLPQRMLSARAKSFLARDVYPDLLMGILSQEELEDDQAVVRAERLEQFREERAEKGTLADRARAKAREKSQPTVKVKAPEPWDAAPPSEPPAPPAEVAAEVVEETEPDSPQIVAGANGMGFCRNWRAFCTPDGALTITPRGSKPGTPLDSFSKLELTNQRAFIETALEHQDYAAAAQRAGLDWLTGEELRAMDEAHLAGLKRGRA